MNRDHPFIHIPHVMSLLLVDATLGALPCNISIATVLSISCHVLTMIPVLTRGEELFFIHSYFLHNNFSLWLTALVVFLSWVRSSYFDIPSHFLFPSQHTMNLLPPTFLHSLCDVPFINTLHIPHCLLASVLD